MRTELFGGRGVLIREGQLYLHQTKEHLLNSKVPLENLEDHQRLESR